MRACAAAAELCAGSVRSAGGMICLLPHGMQYVNYEHRSDANMITLFTDTAPFTAAAQVCRRSLCAGICCSMPHSTPAEASFMQTSHAVPPQCICKSMQPP